MSIPQLRYRIFGREDVVDHTQMRELIRHGEIDASSEIASEGTEKWEAAGKYPELQRYFALAAAQQHVERRPSTLMEARWSIGSLFIIAGLLLGLFSTRDFVNGMASSRWPTTEAQMTYSQLVPTYRAWRTARTHPRWNLYVGYQYRVNGQKYRSNAISFGSEFDSPAHQRSRFELAKPLLAHYDPANPGRAVLDAGVTFGAFGIVFGGIVLLAFGAAAIALPGFLPAAAAGIMAALRRV